MSFVEYVEQRSLGSVLRSDFREISSDDDLFGLFAQYEAVVTYVKGEVTDTIKCGIQKKPHARRWVPSANSLSF